MARNGKKFRNMLRPELPLKQDHTPKNFFKSWKKKNKTFKTFWKTWMSTT